jgi:hypothetical protein
MLNRAREEHVAEREKLAERTRLAEQRFADLEKRALLEIDRERMAQTRLQKALEAERNARTSEIKRLRADHNAALATIGRLREQVDSLKYAVDTHGNEEIAKGQSSSQYVLNLRWRYAKRPLTAHVLTNFAMSWKGIAPRENPALEAAAQGSHPRRSMQEELSSWKEFKQLAVRGPASGLICTWDQRATHQCFFGDHLHFLSRH